MDSRDHAVWKLKTVGSFKKNAVKGNENTHTLTQGNILGFQSTESGDTCLKLGLPNQRTVSQTDDVTGS